MKRLLALLIATPAVAEPLPSWLEKVRQSPAVASIRLDEAAEVAAYGRARLDWRPQVTVAAEAKRKQDSTLPVVKYEDKSAATLGFQQLAFDWGAARTKLDADSAREAAARHRTDRKIHDVVQEAARTYVSAWRASEVHSAANDALIVMRGIMDRAKARKHSDADIRGVQGDIAELEVQAATADKDRLVAIATAGRYAPLKKPVEPKISRVLVTESHEEREALALAVAAERDLIAARLASMPKLHAFVVAENVFGETYPDVTVGVRLSIDLSDKAGSDLDRLKSLADQSAAKGKHRAAEMVQTSRLTLQKTHEKSYATVHRALKVLAATESNRARDTLARINEGKGHPQEAIVALRRLINVRRQIADAAGELALSRVSTLQEPTP